MTAPNHHSGAEGCQGACCLRVENLGVTLEEDVILRNIHFHLHCGEIVALIGPNGAGKTSLLSSLLGQMPHSGTIDFQRAGAGTQRPLIGYVPQSPSFDVGDPVSVLDFFAAAISRYPVFLPVPKALRKRVHDCLQRVKAEALMDQKLGTLSGGELQRVLLAVALEPIPQILILDEPLSGVDVEGEHQLMALLQEIRRDFDLSVLFSTHDFALLPQYADKVILLQQEILRAGAPAEVLASGEFRRAFHLEEGKKGGWSS